MAEAQAGLADEQRRIAGLERKAGQAEAKIKDYEMYRAVVRREERHCCRRRKPAFPCDAAVLLVGRLCDVVRTGLSKRAGTSLCTCLYTQNIHKRQVHFQSLD